MKKMNDNVLNSRRKWGNIHNISHLNIKMIRVAFLGGGHLGRRMKWSPVKCVVMGLHPAEEAETLKSNK
jgi:hypothetical protein